MELHAGAYPTRFVGGALDVVPRAHVEADRVVALPRLVGNTPDGIPHDAGGFVPIDGFCRVKGARGVYAAGDVTAAPVKQGGLAAQQAETAARAIASRLGASVRAEPFRPVLRGLLLTGAIPRYLRRDVTGEGEASVEPLWWPAGKIRGRYLSPALAATLPFAEDARREDVVAADVTS